MSRISAFIFALFLSVCIVLVGAVPVPVPAELVELEGRVNHSGRVSSTRGHCQRLSTDH